MYKIFCLLLICSTFNVFASQNNTVIIKKLDNLSNTISDINAQIDNIKQTLRNDILRSKQDNIEALILEPQQYYQHAFNALKEKKYDAATKIFKDFIIRFPDNNRVGDAYYWIGEIYYTQEKFAQSIIYFSNNIKLNPSNIKASEALLKLAIAFKNTNKIKDACNALHKLNKLKLSEDINQQKAAEINQINCDEYEFQ